MAFEPNFETIDINCKKGIAEGQIKAESKCDVSVETISKILNVSAFAGIEEKEITEKQIKYGGKVTFYVSFVDNEGNIKKCECGNEFSGTLLDDKITSLCRAKIDIVVEKTSIDLSGIKPCVTAYLNVRAHVVEENQIRALSGGEELVALNEEITVTKSFGVKELSYPIEEEFELNYPIEEVLSHGADSVVTAVQCGVGCIIVDGQTTITIIALQKNEKRDIIRESRTFPYRMEIEYEQAMPTMQATASVVEKSFKIDVSVDEQAGKSIVNTSVVLQFEGEAFSLSAVNILKDAFSIKEEIALSREVFSYHKACELRSHVSQVTGRASVKELPASVTLTAVGGEGLEILSYKAQGENIKVTGVLSATGFFKDGEGVIFTEKMEMPFETDIECALTHECDFTIKVKPINASARIISLTETEIEVELIFTVYPEEKGRVEYVKEINCTGEKASVDCAISVYIPFEGEELWSLAKRLNVCPETLMQTNADLIFPLTGEERIVVYRQK